MERKILFLVQVPPPIHGASLRNLSLVQSEYLNDTYTIQLLPLSFAETIESIGKLSIKKVYKLITISSKLVICLLRFRPKLVYFTISPVGGAFYRDLLFVLLIKFFAVKRAYHIRGMGIDKAVSSSLLKRRLYLWAFKNAYVICLSTIHLKDIVQLSCKKKYVVNNGIYLSKYSVRNTYSSSIEKKRILFLSNYVVSKGVLFFVDTLYELRKLNSSFEAIMVGADGDITIEQLKFYIDRKEMTSFISVKGKVSQENIKFDYFKWADIFYFPTYYPNEVFPGVILEAMQSSCAILSTTTGVISDILENGEDGIVESSKCPKVFANHLNLLITQPDEIVRLGKKARINFESKYTMEIFERNMDNVFNEILLQ
ncbi:MAG: glycosyltransferase family 4 protein [Bacteroidetes bacterium]|nr:glycosyltransferase family 4 protein [Bacteroidota bacterium]